MSEDNQWKKQKKAEIRNRQNEIKRGEASHEQKEHL